jgi:hypothetical protein
LIFNEKFDISSNQGVIRVDDRTITYNLKDGIDNPCRGRIDKDDGTSYEGELWLLIPDGFG